MAKKPTCEKLELSVKALEREVLDLKSVAADHRKSEEKYRNIYNRAQVGIFRTRLSDGKVLECNDRFAKNYGFESREECMNHYVVAEHYVDPEARKRMLAQLEEFGEINDFEARFYRKDKRIVWMRFSAVAFYDEGFLEGFGHDVTREKAAEEALRESEKNYRELVENINDIIFKTDEKGVFTYMSPLVERLGFRPEDLIGKHFREIIFPEDLDLVFGRFKALMSSDIRPIEYRIVDTSGNPVWIRSSSRPLFEGDDFTGIQGVVTDISEERRLKTELLHSQKMEAIATLTGGIAHDYNNLLSIIVGNLGLARQDAEPGSDQADFLTEAEKAARKMGDLTHELMALSRGGGPIKELGSIRESLTRATSEVLAGSGIVIEEIVSDHLWPVPRDPRKIGAVFRNVIQNAVEAMLLFEFPILANEINA